MYAEGTGVPRDPAEAATWYRSAAAQGVANALYNLGVLYATGRGVPRDDAEAQKWYRRAAEQGHARSQYNLGVMCANGEGVPQDDVQAHMWLELAAANFPATETENRDKAIQSRDLIAAAMTRVQIAEAQRLAGEWTKKPESEP